MQVELELEKGGMGARKKLRGMGGRENIGEAKWLDYHDGEGVVSVEGEGDGKAGEVMVDEDAFVVPRKRTNADHMITPRKPLGKLEGNVVIVAPVLHVEEQDMEAMKESPKGLKIPLNDLEGGGEQQMKEKSNRRKSSMRKSRRLTKSDLVEESTEDRRGSYVFGRKGDEGVAKGFSGIDAAAPAEQSHSEAGEAVPEAEQATHVHERSPADEEAESENVPESIEPLIDAQESAHTMDQVSSPSLAAVTEVLSCIGSEADSSEILMQQSDPFLEENQMIGKDDSGCVQEPIFVSQEVESQLDTSSKTEEVTTAANENNEGREAFPIVELETIQEQPTSGSNVSIHQSSPLKTWETEVSTEQPRQTPIKAVQFQSVAMQSIESPMLFVGSPTKSAATPRSRRKTPQRTATRRSTRSTRNSSVAREETPLQAVFAQELTMPDVKAASPVVDAQFHIEESSAATSGAVVTSAEVDQDGRSEHAKAATSPAPWLPQADEHMDIQAPVNILQPVTTTDIVTDPSLQRSDIPLETSMVEINVCAVPERDEADAEQDSCDEQLRCESTLR